MKQPNTTPAVRRKAILTLLAFLALSVFMYTTIMYKIVHYGP